MMILEIQNFFGQNFTHCCSKIDNNSAAMLRELCELRELCNCCLLWIFFKCFVCFPSYGPILSAP